MVSTRTSGAEVVSDLNPPEATGFRLNRGLDPIALVALVLALANIGYQIWESRVGAKVTLIPPAQVEVRADARGYTVVHAPMSYSNAARARGSVRSEVVTLRLADGVEPIDLHWEAFIVTDHNQEIAIENVGNAQAFDVEGGGSTSHETAFYPRYDVHCEQCTQDERYRNFLRWEDFVAVAEETDSIDLRFAAVQVGGEPLVVECRLPLDGRMREYMKSARILTRSCVSTDSE